MCDKQAVYIFKVNDGDPMTWVVSCEEHAESLTDVSHKTPLMPDTNEICHYDELTEKERQNA